MAKKNMTIGEFLLRAGFPFLSFFSISLFSAWVRAGDGQNVVTLELILVFLFGISTLIFFYRRTRKKRISFFLFFLISCLLFLLSALLRLYLFELLFPCLCGGVTFVLMNNVSSGGSSSGELSGPPPLESSSSTESLATYRHIIAADNEGQIYQRIRALEGNLYYNLPPQNEEGEYEALVREHFDQALNVDHYLLIFDRETFELRVLEQKGLLQDRLFELMLSQQNIERIYELCLQQQSDIRKAAFYFLQDKLEAYSDPSVPEQRAGMSQTLAAYNMQLNQQGRNSPIYQEFYRDFTNEDLRRLLELPLP